MIGPEAACSLPCWGSSMAMVTLPLDLSPAGFGELGVNAVPPLPDGAVDVPGVDVQAPRTSSDAPASALRFRNFMHFPPRSPSTGWPRSSSVGASSVDIRPGRRVGPASDAAIPRRWSTGDDRTGRGSERRYVTDDNAERWLGRRAGCRR